MLTDLLLFPGIPLAYLFVGAVVGGYYYNKFSDRFDHDQPMPFVFGLFWPGIIFWELFLKPISKLGIRLGQSQDERKEAKQENLRLIRKQLEQTQQELEAAKQEVEKVLVHSDFDCAPSRAQVASWK